jgi:hypothetical protein
VHLRLREQAVLEVRYRGDERSVLMSSDLDDPVLKVVYVPANRPPKPACLLAGERYVQPQALFGLMAIQAAVKEVLAVLLDDALGRNVVPVELDDLAGGAAW